MARTTRAADDAADEEGVVAALTHEGEGIVRGGKTAFVVGALPGERFASGARSAIASTTKARLARSA